MLEIAIIGAGPYGLSIGAHLRSRGIPFRIFGPPMHSWREHMPKGMMLKSDGFASNLSDPAGHFTLKQYCAEQSIPYADDDHVPVRLETFASYGIAFKDRLVPELEEKTLANLERAPGGFLLTLEGGEILRAKRVVLAVGITHFGYIPSTLSHLPEEFVTHSYGHTDLQPFRGRSVVVLGGGASAIGLAGLLAEEGAHCELVARDSKLHFSTSSEGKPRPLWQRIRHPQSGLGPGLRSRFFANSPDLFYHLPERLRVEIVHRHLGPSGHWFSRDKVEDKMPLHLGFTPQRAAIEGSKIRLTLQSKHGEKRDIMTDHIIAGTGYRVDMHRLAFLSPEIRLALRTADGSPVLSPSLESSVAGLYFVGLAAANSFGPVMRFAFGADFAAKNLANTVATQLSRSHREVGSPSLVTATK